MFVGMIRFLQSGWIERFYGEPIFFFRYWGFAWVPVAPVAYIEALYVVLAVLALFIAIGLFYRVSIVLFVLGFTYTELLDVTNYLNHYYLVTLIGGLMCLIPMHGAFSVDAWWRSSVRRRHVPAWCLYLLRYQVAIVYGYAGLAKLNIDWLLYAQPMEIWLRARSETALVGQFFEHTWAAHVFSWGGFLYDSTIVIWLSWRRTRALAFCLVLGFHGMTHVLFNIGLFPFIMTCAATLFFAPSWPRRWLGLLMTWVGRTPPELPRPTVTERSALSHRSPWRQRLGYGLLAGFCAWQLLVPLRHYLYPGDVAWNEEGMRWSWKVMLREKHGSVTYYVRFKETGKVLQVPPRHYLDARQEREMSGQPDLILQLAHHIAADFEGRGMGPVAVHAEALVSWNGRPAAPMIDPEVDLASIEDGLARKHWVLPEPTGPPLQRRRR